MKLRINPLVISDLKEIRESISEDSPQNAEKVVEELYETFENIQEFPYIGVSLSKRVSFKTDYRYFSHKDYVILYRAEKEFVEIYRVVNRYRDFTRIFD